MRTPLIALLTDFGSTDPFVGIMKGVIAGIAPQAHLIDLTHEIPPGDLRRAAINLWQAVPYFPSSTIFLAVVDPGVGTTRRPVLLRSSAGQPGKEYHFIGPDNGLFTFVLSDGFKAWELANPVYRLPEPGMTFHGRDLFAPAAAHVALGVSGPELGPPVFDPVELPRPRLIEIGPGALGGEILYADRFGNALTSLGVFARQADRLLFRAWLPGVGPGEFSARETRLFLSDGRSLPLLGAYGQIPSGEYAALIGSAGLLEIAADRANAAQSLGLEPGTFVTLTTLSR